ncbi:MAG TPA: 2-hydroxyacid dehydrogenase [Cytophagaceae bacterium]|nr:2-hydroxyacid dehydrogenase [Cytophagaceae bacterium]
MKIKFFSIRPYEEPYLNWSNKAIHEFIFETESLSLQNAAGCVGFEAISVFTNDDLSAPVLQKLKEAGVRYIAIRATGYNHVDLKYAGITGIKVANVPDYSPYSVAEQTILMILALSRKLLVADNQVKLYNFTLNNLVGTELHNKTVGIIGMGRIGKTIAKILNGFGCTVLAYDQVQTPSVVEYYKVRYCTKEELFTQADIITLHLPLVDSTKYLINEKNISLMKDGVMLINTGRGGLVNTEAVLDGLKKGKIGSFGMDVYEKEKGVFFFDKSGEVLKDDTLLELMSLKNVLITPHQGFLTSTALQDIANTTLFNINCWSKGEDSRFELTSKHDADHTEPLRLS